VSTWPGLPVGLVHGVRPIQLRSPRKIASIGAANRDDLDTGPLAGDASMTSATSSSIGGDEDDMCRVGRGVFQDPAGQVEAFLVAAGLE
jgi:hypothetical protein